ncbi:MAG: thermonuclease family protein [Acidobacteriota bacterium]
MLAIDGDTLLVARGFGPAEKVRLIGIDAPELGTHFGDLARVWVDRQVRGRWVPMQVRGTDLYGRARAYAEVEGKDLARELLMAGLARTLPFPHERAGTYLAAERVAQREERGMWSPAEPRRSSRERGRRGARRDR